MTAEEPTAREYALMRAAHYARSLERDPLTTEQTLRLAELWVSIAQGHKESGASAEQDFSAQDELGFPPPHVDPKLTKNEAGWPSYDR